MGTKRNASEIIRDFRLVPLPGEGGYYRETYRTNFDFSPWSLTSEDDPDRRLGSAIYYLVTPGSWSSLHRLVIDEVYHFYAGDTVELVVANDDGHCGVISLGSDGASGDSFQWIVPRGHWQGLKLRAGGDWALLGTTTFPGFEFRDCRLASRQDILHFTPSNFEILRSYLAGSSDSP